MRSNLKKLVADREAVLGRHISQKELAEITQLNRNTISRFMSPVPLDRVDSAPIVKLCTALGCGIEELIVIERDPNATPIS